MIILHFRNYMGLRMRHEGRGNGSSVIITALHHLNSSRARCTSYLQMMQSPYSYPGSGVRPSMSSSYLQGSWFARQLEQTMQL